MSTNDELRHVVLRAVTRVAPEVEADDLSATADLQDELDLDSMDMLNVITIVSEELGIDIPEDDYGDLRTLDAAVSYLAGRTIGHTG
jgi:acyl carrier protein